METIGLALPTSFAALKVMWNVMTVYILIQLILSKQQRKKICIKVINIQM